MTARIVRLAEEHVEGFRDVLDSVAREERYLAMLAAPGRAYYDSWLMAWLA